MSLPAGAAAQEACPTREEVRAEERREQQQQQQPEVRILNEQPQMYYPVLEAPSPYYTNTVDAHASASGYPQVSTTTTTTVPR